MKEKGKGVKLLIVEDEVLYADQMEMLIDKLGYHHLATLNNAEAVMRFLENNTPDLILMDVHINGEYDGIELTDMIRRQLEIPIIFVTSLIDDMTFKRASRTNAVNYLLKPFNQLQLQRTIELAILSNTTNKERELSKIENHGEDYFYIKSNNKLDKVLIDDIVYLESDAHYSLVYTENKKFIIHKSLSELHGMLSSTQFLRSHRSYVVNKEKIDEIHLADSVIKARGYVIPLSKRNKNDFLSKVGKTL